MLTLTRAIAATIFDDLLRPVARRSSAEPRYVERSRVPYSPRTLAGVAVTPDTAVTVAAVWACLRYLSQTVAVLPWHVLRDGDRGPAIQPNHNVDWLIWKRVNPEWSSFQFRETLTHWALRHGNGYAEIERDQADRPYRLWPVHPDRTDPCRATEDGVSSSGRAILAGDLFYEVNNGTSGKVTIAAQDMFHIRGFGEGPVGVNVIHYAAQSIGWARAAQLFGSAFFGNNATPSFVVINKKPLKPDGLKLQKLEFEHLFKGVTRSHRAAHLDNDADIKSVAINPKDSQLLELHQFLVEEICRWFGVPPHKVMHLLRATFSNIEHQAIEVVVDSVSPWVKRFEDEADYKLFGAQNRLGFYTKMNMRALLRGDAKTRGEYYKLMREVGAYSVNRILELEDENTIGPDGDKHVMQSQYTTLDRVGEEPVAPAPAGPSIEADPDGDDELHARRQSRIDALRPKCLAPC